MNSFTIALRSIQQRGLASSLTMLSMALGVMMVVAVLTIHGVVSASFRNNSSLGYNVIVGAKGGEEQLTLNTVYYLHRPVENISGNFYMEFLPKEKRRELLKTSLSLGANQLREDTAALADLSSFCGIEGLGTLSLQAAANQIDENRIVELNRNGKYSLYCEFAIPLCLGDYLDRFRVVGTTPEFFDLLVYGPENELTYQFASGRNFKTHSPEHSYFEAVLGAAVARSIQVRELTLSVSKEPEKAAKLLREHANVAKVSVESGKLIAKLGVNVDDNIALEQLEVAGYSPKLLSERTRPLEVGDEISPSHGAPDGHVHQRRFTIVGILKSTGTPNDRAAFINMEGFYLMEDHAKPLEAEEIGEGKENSASGAADEGKPESNSGAKPLPLEQREVTSLLVRTKDPRLAPALRTAVNEGPFAQVVFPVQVIYNLFDFVVRPIQQLLLFLTVMICLVSGLSILVSLYNSMSDRRHEIAVMRALGARRHHVLAIILMEAVLLAVGGGVLGFLGAQGLIFAIGPYVENQTGVTMGVFQMEPRLVDLLAVFSSEVDTGSDNVFMRLPAVLVLVPLVLTIAVMVGVWPSISAYRTDVAKSLGK